MSGEIRQARPADVPGITRALTAAFMDDPVQRWAFPDPARRARYGRHFFAMHARRLVPRGLAWTTDGGASLWAAPQDAHLPAAAMARMAARAWPGVLPHPVRVVRGLLGVDAHHPKEPHVYLAVIGVRPDRVGRGLGGALLTPGLLHADALGLPCYLESSNPRNIPLYERRGFHVIAEHVLPGGPPMWPMWRAAGG